MDDSADKIRRNLVAASAAVLASAWLDVPLADAIHAAVKVEVQPERLLSAGLAVIAYFLFRFRFTPETANFVTALNGTIYSEQIALADRLSDRSLAHFHSTGIRIAPLVTDVDAALAEAAIGNAHLNMDVRPLLQRERIDDLTTAPWDRTYTANVIEQPTGGLKYNSVGRPIAIAVRFEIKGAQRLLLIAQGMFKGAFYSEFASTVIAPLGLAFTAILILWMRIVLAAITR